MPSSEPISLAEPASGSFDERLEALFASEPAAMAGAETLFRELREAGRTHEFGPLVIVTRYADVKAIFRDAEGFASGAKHRGTWADMVRARLNERERRAHDDISAFESLQMVVNGGETHDRLRRIAHRAFSPRRIAELHAAAQRYVDEMLAELAGEEQADLAVLAYRLPLILIADLLGVPESDRELIHTWSKAIGRNRGGTEPGPLLEAHAALQEFRAYVEEILERHRRTPDPTEFVSACVDGEREERLTPEEVTSMFVMLLFAGHETTTNLIATGLRELLQARDQWAALCADPALVPAAVEELLRHVTPVQFSSRVAVADTEIAGTLVPAGKTVRMLTAAANRDPEVFPDGDRVDLRRANARDHLALGFGLHFCLGASLARLEGAVAFGTLAARFPDLELASAEAEWTGNAALRKLKSLPVELGRPREVHA